MRICRSEKSIKMRKVSDEEFLRFKAMLDDNGGRQEETGAEFFLDMIPPTVTHQQKKVAMTAGRPMFYEPPRLAAARELLTLRLLPHRPQEPCRQGVKLTVRWQFPRGRRRAGYRITRPDTDNLQKLLKDCMTAAGFWKDDALVAVEHVEKLWSDEPGIYIRIEALA